MLGEHSRNILGIYLPESLSSYEIPAIFLGFPTLGFPCSSLYEQMAVSVNWGVLFVGVLVKRALLVWGLY